ncbi:MAG: hypothetical protein DBP00_07260 [gamma proteobacterium symbiont of Ctena orbiculata]|nr:MAG: hypothetical protein DBP00_07260 [gamma proteobacterium symbiont of Ctena orbiculata]
MGILDKKNKAVIHQIDLKDLKNFGYDDSGTLYWRGKKVHTGWFSWATWLPIIISLLLLLTLFLANMDKILSNFQPAPNQSKSQMQKSQIKNKTGSKKVTP